VTNPVFDVWAPLESGPGAWSRWAKPILFHALVDEPVPAPVDAPPLAMPWAPAADGRTALVVDVPGARAVALGVALARLGWRPVPVFNGAPPPFDVRPAVAVAPMIAALAQGAATLAGVTLPPTAPPAFLLDADRAGQGKPLPGEYDNRWIVLPQDLPSGDWLVAHGVREVLVVTGAAYPSDDLAHALERWRRAGLGLLAVDPDVGAAPGPLAPRPPVHFRSLVYAFFARLGLSPNAAGAFGAVVPVPPPPDPDGTGRPGGFYGGFS